MVTVLQQRAAQQRGGIGSGVVSFPAPVGGRNARDAQDAMPASDALSLINFFPDVGRVVIRRGHTSHATNVGTSDVESLMKFDNGDGTETLLAAAGTAIYDATVAGTASLLGSGYSNARWQELMFNGQLGMLNGADAPIKYDGASVTVMAASGSGLTNTDLIGGIAYKSRTYFWEKAGGTNPRSFWFSATNALGGSLTQFDLSQKAGFSGYLLAMGVWSQDAGDGLDDYLVTFMSDGTITVWNGTDPGDVTAWSHVGTYQTGEPLSRRGVIRRGGELIIMTNSGYMPLNAVIRGGTAAIALSDKIFGDVRDNAENYSTNFGWQAIEHPSGKAMYFNVPVSETTFHQDVLNTITGAWTTYQNMNARCWGKANSNLYFGGADGIVYQADNGSTDNGANIRATGRQAFQHFTQRGTKSRVTGVKPQLRVISAGTFSYSAGVDLDFQERQLVDDLYTVTSNQKNWEDFTDVEWETWLDMWNSSVQFVDAWLGAFGHGSAFSGRLQVSSQDTVEWFSTTFSFEAGGHCNGCLNRQNPGGDLQGPAAGFQRQFRYRHYAAEY